MPHPTDEAPCSSNFLRAEGAPGDGRTGTSSELHLGQLEPGKRRRPTPVRPDHGGPCSCSSSVSSVQPMSTTLATLPASAHRLGNAAAQELGYRRAPLPQVRWPDGAHREHRRPGCSAEDPSPPGAHGARAAAGSSVEPAAGRRARAVLRAAPGSRRRRAAGRLGRQRSSGRLGCQRPTGRLGRQRPPADWDASDPAANCG